MLEKLYETESIKSEIEIIKLETKNKIFEIITFKH